MVRKENIIAFVDVLPPELGLHSYIDYNLMFQKTFIAGVNNIIEAMNWTTTPVATLEDFFDFGWLSRADGI